MKLFNSYQDPWTGILRLMPLMFIHKKSFLVRSKQCFNLVVTRPNKSGYLFSPVKIVRCLYNNDVCPASPDHWVNKNILHPPPPLAPCEVNVWTPVCADTGHCSPGTRISLEQGFMIRGDTEIVNVEVTLIRWGHDSARHSAQVAHRPINMSCHPTLTVSRLKWL